MEAKGRGNTNFGSMEARGGVTQTLGRWGRRGRGNTNFGLMEARGRGNTNFGSMGARGGVTQTLGRWRQGVGATPTFIAFN